VQTCVSRTEMTAPAEPKPAALEEDGHTGLPLERFAADAHALESGAFAARRGRAFLLHNGPLAALNRAVRTQQTLVTEIRLRDRCVDLPFVVFPLFPASSSAPAALTLGRGRSSDLVLGERSVSKLHAVIRLGARGGVTVEDAGSQNGTFVDDQRIPTNGASHPRPLVSGCLLRLGEVELTYLEAAELQALVRALVPELRRP